MSSHTRPSRRIIGLVVAAVLATLGSIPASFAQEPVKDARVASTTINYSDLNLASPQGSRALHRRVVDAARKVCPELGPMADLGNNRDARLCIAETVDRTLKQIQVQQLAQVAVKATR